MALHITDNLIASDVTPEVARRVPGSVDGQWFLTWLPDYALTREQAISGMVLDEILSAPEPADDGFAMELATLRADSLGLELPDVVLRLCARIVERDLRNSGALPSEGESTAVSPEWLPPRVPPREELVVV